MSELQEDQIQKIVRKTVRELMRNGMLKRADDVAYSEISSRLFEYYKAPERDKELAAALEKVTDDLYFGIIPMYYGQRNTIYELADAFKCELSTVTRNKKRLCLKLFLTLQ